MSEKKKPKVILLESDQSTLEQAENALSNAGWKVVSFRKSIDALNHLSESPKKLFALFLTDSKLPKMEGDAILEKVKNLSPLTQRMIMVPQDNPDILINSINKARVNACIPLPFKDDDLVALAKNCFKRFRHALKKKQLKRVSEHQNQQMYKAAQKLKKKDKQYKQIIDEKKSRLRKLKSKKRKISDLHQFEDNISLSDLIDKKEIQPTPDALQNEFILLGQTIQKQFTELIGDTQGNKLNLSFRKAISDPGIIEMIKPDDHPVESPDPELEDLASKDQDNDDQNDTGTDSEPGSEDIIEQSIPEGMVDRFLRKLFLDSLKTKPKSQTGMHESSDSIILDEDETDETVKDSASHPMDEFFEISLSEDYTKAVIKRKKPVKETDQERTSGDILDLLRHKEISYGILEDEAIETWIKKSTIDSITVAEGFSAEPGENGKVDYHFQIDYTNPGKIDEDGTIDFRDRGETPFVKTGDLLAAITPAKQGKSGTTVSGTPIPVEEVEEPVFETGPGTQLSEDGLSILASIDGQPHLDKLGTVSVNPELVIPGDVDYETGNITFEGNIIVKGMIKEGFSVKGINLTAQEIEGGIIDISGDLNVSAGITEATISAQGNIHAKFINKSKISSFGDLCVTKEIIDSTILISGKCRNETGHIIACTISSKLGVEAGKIGTPSSKPSTFKVGIDEHIQLLRKKIDEKLEDSVNKSKLIKDEIKKLEDEDQALYQQISEKAQIQDRAQLDIKEMLKELKTLTDSNDIAQAQLIKDEIKRIKQTATTAEKELNTIFEMQDKIASDIQSLKDRLSYLENVNKNHVQEKKVLKDFERKEEPQPMVSVSKIIIQGNKIKGPHSSIVLNEDKKRCKIQEIGHEEAGISLFEMNITDLN